MLKSALIDALKLSKWWAQRDAGIFVIGLMIAAPIALAVRLLATTTPDEFAMIVTAPVLVFYIECRVFAAFWTRPSPRRGRARARSRFARISASLLAGALIMAVVSAGTSFVFAVFGPRRATFPALGIVFAGVLALLFGIACLLIHGSVKAGHRMILTVVDRAETELSAWLEWARTAIGRLSGSEHGRFRYP